jgi:hypothetical protein
MPGEDPLGGSVNAVWRLIPICSPDNLSTGKNLFTVGRGRDISKSVGNVWEMRGKMKKKLYIQAARTFSFSFNN